MKIPEKFKKYSVIIALACSTMVLTGFGIYINYAKGANTLYLQDITGSRELLKGVKIEGIIGDETHTQYVSIENGEVSSRFTLDSIMDIENAYSSITPELSERFSLIPTPDANIKTTVVAIDNPQIVFNNNMSIFPEDKGIEYTVETDSVDLYAEIIASFPEAVSEDLSLNGLRFQTGLYVDKEHNNQKPIVLIGKGVVNKQSTIVDASVPNNLYESILPYDANISWAKLDDKYYFTIPSNKNFSGTNGIYRIDELESEDSIPLSKDMEKYLHDMLFDSSKYGKITSIVDVPLERNVQVFGLEMVSDKLLFLKGEDKRMVLELYDRFGTQLDRLLMPVSLDASLLQECRVQAFEIGDNAGINIRYWYNRGDDPLDSEAGPYASVSISDTLKLDYYYEEYDNSIDYAVQQNGNLIMLSSNVDYLHPQLWKTQYSSLNILVYAPTEDLKGKLIYKGKLVSDIGDDSKRMLYNQANSEPRVYDYPYRTDNFFAPGYKYDKRSYGSFDIKEIGKEEGIDD